MLFLHDLEEFACKSKSENVDVVAI